jgi:Tfp pilus assembly protein PilX
MSDQRLIRRVHRPSLANDEGVALIFVIGIIMVMSILVATSVAYAISTKPAARHGQDWNAALAAAQAGVDDYVAKLNKSDSYAQTIDCSNAALKGPKLAGNCTWTSSTAPGWVNVAGSTAKPGQFHYDVDASEFWKNGSVRLNSTGKVNGISRTIQVRVSRGGSTEFLYYTDFEDADPDNRVSYPSGPATDQCGKSGPSSAKYWFQTRSGCSEIQFAGFDVLDGKVHFNDTPLMGNNGGTRPRFLQGFETADPNCTVAAGKPDSNGVAQDSLGKGKCWRSTSSAAPFVGTSGAVPASPLYLPDNSDKFATFPGCQFTGDTRIRFNSNGTMDVWNTGSSSSTVTGPGTPAGFSCGVATNYKPATGQKYPGAKQTVAVPNDMVIYVKNSTAGSGTCTPGQVVNGTDSGSNSGDVIPLGDGGGYATTDVTDISYFDPDDITTTQAQTWTRAKPSTQWKWTGPTTTGPTTSINSDDHPKTFDCGLGNVYVEGTVKGRVTIAAENNVVVTGNLTVSGASGGTVPQGPDMVGLVAANSVVVYHPVRRSSSAASTVAKTPSAVTGTCPNLGSAPDNAIGSNSNYTMTCTYQDKTTFGNSYTDLSYPAATSSGSNRYVFASIQTLQHSFWVQSYNRGNDQGKLSVRGSIAQKWRGAVGTSGGTGFAKDYSYDQRLQFSSPPYFPQWTNAVWGAKTTGELRAQY